MPTISSAEPGPFIVQLTRDDNGLAQRRIKLQIKKSLEELGENKIRFEVVAYEGGIVSLLANNDETNTLVAALSRQGVVFKACKISIAATGLIEEDLPLEVVFVPAGAPEVLRLQMQGYRYWRP
jgi:intracellular sulfur oxidation DsrE/DsrF family protein